MAAFVAAIALGAGIECDLRLTADGVPVIFHDRDGARLCGSALVVSQSTAAEVARLRLADGQPIPTLAELLDRTQGRVPLLLELKEERNAARFSAAVAAQLVGYDGPVGVMSFAAGVGQWLKRHAPAVRRGLVLSGRESRLARWVSMRRADPQFLAIGITQLGARTLPVYAWTVRTPADRVRAAPLADALIWEADGRP